MPFNIDGVLGRTRVLVIERVCGTKKGRPNDKFKVKIKGEKVKTFDSLNDALDWIHEFYGRE